MFSKEKLFTIMKCMFMEKKIIVYSQLSNNICSFILSLISLIPGNSLYNLNIGHTIKLFQVKCVNLEFDWQDWLTFKDF
jgi:hypothetical protein